MGAPYAKSIHVPKRDNTNASIEPEKVLMNIELTSFAIVTSIATLGLRALSRKVVPTKQMSERGFDVAGNQHLGSGRITGVDVRSFPVKSFILSAISERGVMGMPLIHQRHGETFLSHGGELWVFTLHQVLDAGFVTSLLKHPRHNGIFILVLDLVAA